MSLIQRIDALLPQTQCGKCGHPGCKPYAEGLSGGEAINKCPPGGDETIAQLAQLLRVPVIALDTERGFAPSQVAFIREAECIGCTKCIQACPVDAIVGAAKLMHTVIVDECTGCDLCVAPCPVDCIEMRPLPPATTAIVGGLAFSHTQYQARLKKRDHARHRFEARTSRLRREDDQRLSERLARARKTLSAAVAPQAETGNSPSGNAAANSETAMKQARIAVAMSRAQLNKSLKAFGHPPIAEQAARLVELQREFERAEHALEILKAADSGPSAVIASKPDNASLNRAKIQLAMRRATLKKAFAAQAPADQIETLNAAVIEAERMLRELEPETPAGFRTNT